MSKWIESERLILRPFRLTEWRSMIKYIYEPEIWKYIDQKPPTDKDVRQLVAYNVELQTERDGFGNVIPVILKPNYEFIGHVLFQWNYQPGKTMETAVIICPKHQGKGYGLEALKNVLKYAFDEMKIHKIVASCDVRNIPACRIMEKAGMTREGLFREAMLIEEKWQNEYFYGMLESDWKNLKENKDI